MAPTIDQQLLRDIRASYLRPWKYSCPVVGRIEDADCIWAFAFGRNTYTDAELGPTIEALRKNTGSNTLEMYSLLWGRKFDPGYPNMQLANVAANLATQWMWETKNQKHLPVIAQWEVPFKLYVPGNRDPWDHWFPFWPPADKPYFNSLDVCRNASESQKNSGVRSLQS